MSISPAAHLITRALRWWPQTIDLSRYRMLLTWEPNEMGQAFLAALRNSLTVAVTAVLLVAAPGACVVSCNRRMEFSFHRFTLTFMLPPVAPAVPPFIELARFGLSNLRI